MSNSITAEKLQERLKGKAKICLVDVRRKADYDRYPAMIEGAVWRDPEKIGEWGETLPTDSEVILYCVKGGQVSQSVAATLKLTHPDTTFLEGGLLGWESR